MKITVVKHSAAWAEEFRKEAETLRGILKSELVKIYHIGSTAVPDLWAKPVIDIMPVVKETEKIDAFRAALENVGYEYMGEYGIPDRRFLKKGGDFRTHNVHIFGIRSEYDIRRHLAVRDYLRTHPDEAAQYGELKKKLARLYPDDIGGYCDGKDDFVKALEKKALDFFENRLQTLDFSEN
ncbi:MAG: hypothetical protein DBX59_09035 [Bacillota bacterium]|nr:MAG: hypothetical protein DBX59_09035 [Bacillota bacterium]